MKTEPPSDQDSVEGASACDSNRRRKYAGAATYKCKFQKIFTKKWPCIQTVVKDVHKFYCTVCRCTINCGHMGKGDILRHVTGKRHTEKTAEADRAILYPSLKIPRADSALQDKVKNTVLV